MIRHAGHHHLNMRKEGEMLLKSNGFLGVVLFIGYACGVQLDVCQVLPVAEEVTIIGGGLAGLTLAYELEKQGFLIEIYEARPRLGGRVLSIDMNGNIAELGGQNICDAWNGEDGQDLLIIDLILELGLALEHRRLDRFVVQYFDGTKLIDVRNRLKEMLCSPRELWYKLVGLQEDAFSMEDVLNKLFPFDPLLREIFSIKLADYEGGAVRLLSPFVIDSLFNRLLTCIRVSVLVSGDPVKQFSSMYVKGGNGLLIERLAENIAGPIHLNMPLTKMRRDVDGLYHLTFADGSTKTSRIVVLTMPCSVYEDIDIASDVIPEETLTNIQQVRYGTNAKILMPSYGEQQLGVFTNGRMVCYFSKHLGTVTSYYVHENGSFDENTVQEHFERDMRLLRHVYDLPGHIPGVMLAKDAQFMKYNGPVGHSWPLDPYAKGSYSYIGAGQEEVLESIDLRDDGELVRTLFKPLHQDTLFFAGEHATVLLDICGTLEAAVESGKRTARMICKSWHPEYRSNSLTRALFLGILIRN